MHRTAPKQWDSLEANGSKECTVLEAALIFLKVNFGSHGTNGGAVYPTNDGVSFMRYRSSSNSEPAYLGSIIVVAITVVVIIESEINYLLWTGQGLLEGGESIVVRVKRFSLRSVGCANRRDKLA
jgi:hypothetical protein